MLLTLENTPELAPPVFADNEDILPNFTFLLLIAYYIYLIIINYCLNEIKIKNYNNVGNMLFRNSDGFIVEIKKSDFKNDHVYYSALMKIKTKLIQQSESQNKNKNKTKTTIKSNSKIDAFFNKNCEPELTLKQQSKCIFYSKQAINKLLDEF